MTIESSKNLGGVGALLMFIGVFPYISSYGVVEIVGLILVLVALYSFAGYYKERGIFNNSIYGLIAGIVGVILAAAVGLLLVLPNVKDFLLKLYPSWNGDLSTISSLSGLTPNTSNITISDVMPFIVAAIAVLVILWIFVIIVAFFARRSLKALSVKASVGLFSTASLLLLIGAFLAIVGIGFILMWIAVLLIAIAFFQIKPQPEQPIATAAPSPSTPTPV